MRGVFFSDTIHRIFGAAKAERRRVPDPTMPEIIINGPDGRLEGRYRPGKTPSSPCALVLHPHPLQGGNMNNRVVYALYTAFVDRGFTVLRFNFRGVGRSLGRFDAGIGELSDAAHAFDWMQQQNPYSRFSWIGGYSFGALISMQLMMRRPEIGRFIAVAPPAETDDFSFLAPCPASGLIVHGDADRNVALDSVNKLAKKIGSQKNIKVNYDVLKGADHFFQDHMDELVERVNTYLDKSLAELAEA